MEGRTLALIHVVTEHLQIETLVAAPIGLEDDLRIVLRAVVHDNHFPADAFGERRLRDAVEDTVNGACLVIGRDDDG